MIAELKSEVRKLATIRSTYIVSGVAVVIVLFVAGFLNGWRQQPEALQWPNYLQDQITSAVTVVSIFAAIVALLLVVHEYRYNTIMYTLTATNNRLKTLFAKVLVASSFAVIFTLVLCLLSPLSAYVGAQLHGHTVGPQTFDVASVLWRSLFYGWGYTMFAVIIAAIIRNQVGAIVVFFVAPTTIENVASLLLKDNAKYLPYRSLFQVIGETSSAAYSAVNAAVVTGVYILVGLIIAAVLFVRRDAN